MSVEDAGAVVVVVVVVVSVSAGETSKVSSVTA
jgi:hypothetical protein